MIAFVLVVFVIVIYIGRRWYTKFKILEGLNWLPRVPGWPILGNLLEFESPSNIVPDVTRLIKNYGKTLVLDIAGLPIIMTTDYHFVEYVLGTQHIMHKSNAYKFLHNWLGTGILTGPGETKWKTHRRLVTPAFYFSILAKFVEVFEKNGKILIRNLENESKNDSVDIYKLATLFALDVICETAMGVSVNAQLNADSDYVKYVREMSKIPLGRSISLFKKNDLLYKFSRDHYKEKKAVKGLHDVTYSVIDARRSELKENKSHDERADDVGRKAGMTFLDILLQSAIDGVLLSRDEIREEVDTFMFGGHDTTSSGISFTLLLLAHHPDIQKQVFEEQRSIFEDDLNRTVTFDDLNQMRYLESVVKESMRLLPPVPLIGRMTNRDVQYKGNTIPAGTSIAIFIHGIHKDPDYFPDPEKFDPSRFLQNDGTNPYSYIPFSAGPRNCIGQKFAMLEMKSCLSNVIRKFELRPSVPEHKMIMTSNIIFKSENGVKLRFLKRG